MRGTSTQLDRDRTNTVRSDGQLIWNLSEYSPLSFSLGSFPILVSSVPSFRLLSTVQSVSCVRSAVVD